MRARPGSARFGAVLAALAGLALLVICAREIAGLFRLASIEKLRARAELALAEDDRDAARAIVRELTAKLSATPQLARSRGELESASRRKSSTAATSCTSPSAA